MRRQLDEFRMLGSLYRILTDIAAPFIRLYLHKRKRDGREDRYRFRERLGFASQSAPAHGQVIWCHAASVGEAASLLALIEKILQTYADVVVVITTGTVTSARMLSTRLPQRAIHQYVPVDRHVYVDRFLSHWQPSMAIWVESELWPNTLQALKDRAIPTLLLNGRMSEKSFRNWYRYKAWARQILSTFSLCLVQTEEARGRYIALGASPVKVINNLKYSAAPLPVDTTALHRLQEALAGRLSWAMASTHRGEEEIALDIHRDLRAKGLEVVTVIIPRHPARGDEVARLIDGAGFPFARRSKGDQLTASTQIYLADTLGELGLFYRLSPVTALGGSFVAVGGHNPIEPAQLATAIIFGPSMYNFSSIAREFLGQKAALQLRYASELSPHLERWLTNPDARRPYIVAAQALADQKLHLLDDIMNQIKPWLNREVPDSLRRGHRR